MDLIGSFADGYFSLALHATSSPASLMENSRRIALSDIPIEHTQLAYELGKNHNRSSVDWSHIAFATTASALIPVAGASIFGASARNAN